MRRRRRRRVSEEEASYEANQPRRRPCEGLGFRV
jgi:hypothetical protein